jgi:chitodextrinase
MQAGATFISAARTENQNESSTKFGTETRKTTTSLSKVATSWMRLTQPRKSGNESLTVQARKAWTGGGRVLANTEETGWWSEGVAKIPHSSKSRSGRCLGRIRKGRGRLTFKSAEPPVDLLEK